MKQLLDVEKEAAVVTEGVGTFDIIFATNVLHATRNMSNTLLNCKVERLRLEFSELVPRARLVECKVTPFAFDIMHRLLCVLVTMQHATSASSNSRQRHDTYSQRTCACMT